MTIKERSDMDIATLLDNAAHGAARTRVNEKLAEFIEAVEATGKGGSLTITIKLERKDRFCAVGVECKGKIPEEDIPAGIFFLAKGQLHVNDPQQMSFDGVRSIDGGADARDKRSQ